MDDTTLSDALSRQLVGKRKKLAGGLKIIESLEALGQDMTDARQQHEFLRSRMDDIHEQFGHPAVKAEMASAITE